MQRRGKRATREQGRSAPSRKLALAAIRSFFDLLTIRHAVFINPALSVRGERHSVIEGKTPEITKENARQLLASIDTSTLTGLRDRAICAALIYTAFGLFLLAGITLATVYAWWKGTLAVPLSTLRVLFTAWIGKRYPRGSTVGTVMAEGTKRPAD